MNAQKNVFYLSKFSDLKVIVFIFIAENLKDVTCKLLLSIFLAAVRSKQHAKCISGTDLLWTCCHTVKEVSGQPVLVLAL